MTDDQTEAPIIALELLVQYGVTWQERFGIERLGYWDDISQRWDNIRQLAKQYVQEHELQDTPMDQRSFRWTYEDTAKEMMVKMNAMALRDIEKKVIQYHYMGFNREHETINDVLRDLGRVECLIERMETEEQILPSWLKNAQKDGEERYR